MTKPRNYHLKTIRADEVRGGQIIEWCDQRCRVASVEDCVRGKHARQRGSHRAAVVLHVEIMTGPKEGEHLGLHYFADELVPKAGWSFGNV